MAQFILMSEEFVHLLLVLHKDVDRLNTIESVDLLFCHCRGK